MEAVPERADWGLGCGTPLVRAGLRERMTVLNLGSGAGFDVFLATRMVGVGGHIAISDIVARFELPEEIHPDPALYIRCMVGAETIAHEEVPGPTIFSIRSQSAGRSAGRAGHSFEKTSRVV